MSKTHKSVRKTSKTGAKTAGRRGQVQCAGGRPRTRRPSKAPSALRSAVPATSPQMALKNLFGHAWDAIVVTDRARRIVDANPAACRLVGISRTQLLRMRIDDFRPDVPKREYRQLLDDTLRPPLLRGEHVLRTADGDEKTLDIIGARIDKNHAIFVFRDISELKRVEERIKESEEKFRSIIRDAGLGIVYVDLAGVHVDVNDAFCAMTGFCREELVGHGLPYPYWPKDQTVRFVQGMRSALAGHVTVAETVFVKKDGGRLPVRVHPSFVRDHTGATVGQIGIFEDISPWETLQQELIYAQKMQAVGALAGGIVHEFNNLHGGMHLTIEEVLTEVGQELPIREKLEAVLERLERASSITRLLKTFGLKTPCQRARASLSDVLEDALGIADATLKKDKVSVELDLAEDVPEMVLDRAQMVQAMLNLILNARDAMETAHVKRLRVESGVRDGKAFVRLSDTGSGIAAEYIASIFDPFFTTKEDRGEQVRSGFGLGLTVSEAIISDHGGTIDVSSTVGTGSSFTVWLPLEMRPAPSRISPPGELYARTRGKRVLVLVNDSALKTLTDNALKRVGCAVDTAQSVDQGVSLVAGGRYDIVVVGLLGLPGGRAEELLGSIQKVAPASRPATVAVAGEGCATGPEKSARPRADAVLCGPVTLESFYAAVEEAVAAGDKRRGRSTAGAGDSPSG